MDEVIQITKDIKSGNIKPIYFFMGEEPYYIDKLTEFIEDNVLQEHERDFNQTIMTKLSDKELLEELRKRFVGNKNSLKELKKVNEELISVNKK